MHRTDDPLPLRPFLSFPFLSVRLTNDTTSLSPPCRLAHALPPNRITSSHHSTFPLTLTHPAPSFARPSPFRLTGRCFRTSPRKLHLN